MFAEIEMLETLKKDYLGMNFEVEFTKYGLTGIIEGLKIKEKMNFVNWRDALDWATKVNLNEACPFVVIEMTNPTTGKKELF